MVIISDQVVIHLKNLYTVTLNGEMELMNGLVLLTQGLGLQLYILGVMMVIIRSVQKHLMHMVKKVNGQLLKSVCQKTNQSTHYS